MVIPFRDQNRRGSLLTAIIATIALTFPGSRLALALGGPQYVSDHQSRGSFALVHRGKPATIMVDPSDWPGVIRAAGDLADDIDRVTGLHPKLRQDRAAAAESTEVIIGTIGKSELIDDLVRSGKLNVADVRGKWESAVTTIVDRPLPGVRRALVIAGADKRGTIYGIYDLSEQIGVSPWYWWADVRVPHQDALYVLPLRVVQPVPAVKYRGIFFNDEAPCLSGWTKEKFGGMNREFYTKVFELLLRLKANFLWPAMWNNAFATDDPLNPKLADEYGIVMGTSHEEPMMRAEKEWTSGHHGAWDYSTNQQEIDQFWREGMERDKNYEEVVTLGMRGHGDTPMSAGANMNLLERIVSNQQQILKQTVNPDLSNVPQLWALYKEVQDYYDKGMRVPDDVTLLWSDDNWGNLRRLPTADERKRSGGAGIYYHFDYVGGPRSYKWLNTNPIPKVQEQMHLAFKYGADRLWVVNVGDLKPMEFPIEFFLDYARTPQRWDKDHLDEFTRQWATREFGPQHADEIATAMEQYTRYNGRRKPELIDPTTFSLTNYHEADRVYGEWQSLEDRVDKLATELPENERASYFELIQYPVDACANLTEMYIEAARNALDAQLGNPKANDEAAQVQQMFARDAALSDDYNHKLLNGKWDHMMDQTHIGYTTWREPPKNIMPTLQWINVPQQGALRVAIGDATGAALPLGEFDSVAQQTKFVTLFNTGISPVEYHLKASAPWVLLNQPGSLLNGTLTKELQMPVRINWNAVPAGISHATIEVASSSGPITNLSLIIRKQQVNRQTATGFVESDGYIAIEAAHTSARTTNGSLHWDELPGYGRTLSAMAAYPVTAPTDLHSAAGLHYAIQTYDAGPFNLRMVLAPTLNFVPGRGLRCAVSIDGGPRTVIDSLAQNTSSDWAKAVADAVREVDVPVNIPSSGNHTLDIWFVDPGLVLERLILTHQPIPPSYLGPPESFHPAVIQPK